MLFLKQSTARTIVLKLYLSSDHVSLATGKTLTVTLSKNGAAFAAAAGSVAEIANGWYSVALTSADTNTLGVLVVRATAASCDDAEIIFDVVAFDPQDANALGLANVTAIKAKTDNLPASPAATGDIPTAAAIRAEIDSNSTKLDVTVGSRLATAGYTAGPTAAAIALAIFTYDLSTIVGEASRSLLNAVRFLRNRWSISGSTLTVTKEDDTTAAWTAAITTSASQDAVVGTDPA